jgi:hypothetical protein
MFPNNKNIKNRIEKIKAQHNSPEEINGGKDTHPSARIIKIIPSYNKKGFASQISGQISIEKIRKECPHFDTWIQKLENP